MEQTANKQPNPEAGRRHLRASLANAVDAEAPTPLYLQVRQCLEEWIATLQPGDRLPGEMEIMTWAGVTRKTVRKAMESLVESGILIKKKRLGTFLARRPAPDFADPHPLERPLGPLVPAREGATLALFGGTPYQKRGWERLAEGFSARTGERLRLAWAPFQIDSDDLYLSFLQEHNASAALFNTGQARAFCRQKRLHPLPAPWGQCLNNPVTYGTEMLSGDIRRLLDHVAPLYCAAWGVAWNTDLATDPTAREGAALWADSLGMHLSNPGSAKEDTPILLAGVSALLMGRGLPPAPIPQQEATEWFRESFTALLPLRAVAERLAWEESEPYGNLKRFLRGQVAFAAGNMHFLPHYLDEAPFPWKARPFVPQTETAVLPSGFDFLGLPAGGDSARGAIVLEYLLSREGQALLAGGLRRWPYRRDAMEALGETFFGGCDADVLQQVAGAHRIHDEHLEGWRRLVEEDLRPVLRSLIAGEVDPARAADLACVLARQRGLRHLFA